jgi:hypothetical protein
MEDDREDTGDRSWTTKDESKEKGNGEKSQPVEIVYARVVGYKSRMRYR